MRKEIPIFFSTDDAYIPYLDVAISSLTANASRAYDYRILVLNTGLRQENVQLLKRHEHEGVFVEFADISAYIEQIRSRLTGVYHFTPEMYYRLFIASLFPQYDKVLYLDCDLVVLGDISELYGVDLGSHVLGAVPDQFVRLTHEFQSYTKHAIGVDPNEYVNSGVLLINLAAFRENRIEEGFIYLISRYDFKLLDPDQAYLNYLCRGKIRLLPNGWNKTPTPLACEGKKHIVHYALYKKPWQYDDVIDGNYFWDFAKRSPFFEQILARKRSFGAAERAKKEATAQTILANALDIVRSEITFSKLLCKGGTR